jgi:hypothetical protein
MTTRAADSDALPIERYRRRFGTMDVTLTIDDPKAYTCPWTVNAARHV